MADALPFKERVSEKFFLSFLNQDWIQFWFQKRLENLDFDENKIEFIFSSFGLIMCKLSKAQCYYVTLPPKNICTFSIHFDRSPTFQTKHEQNIFFWNFSSEDWIQFYLPKSTENFDFDKHKIAFIFSSFVLILRMLSKAKYHYVTLRRKKKIVLF